MNSTVHEQYRMNLSIHQVCVNSTDMNSPRHEQSRHKQYLCQYMNNPGGRGRRIFSAGSCYEPGLKCPHVAASAASLFFWISIVI
jgi:hypothetical protein